MKVKYIMSDIDIERPPQIGQKDNFGNIVYLDPERLKVTINYVGEGDVKSISNKQLLDVFLEKLNVLENKDLVFKSIEFNFDNSLIKFGEFIQNKLCGEDWFLLDKTVEQLLKMYKKENNL